MVAKSVVMEYNTLPPPSGTQEENRGVGYSIA